MNTQRDHIRIAPAISAGLLPRVLPLLLIGGCRVLWGAPGGRVGLSAELLSKTFTSRYDCPM